MNKKDTTPLEDVASIIEDRQQYYGKPQNNLKREAIMIDAFLKMRQIGGDRGELQAWETGMMNTLRKLCRMYGPMYKKDDFVDHIGYTNISHECYIDEVEKNE